MSPYYSYASMLAHSTPRISSKTESLKYCKIKSLYNCDRKYTYGTLGSNNEYDMNIFLLSCTDNLQDDLRKALGEEITKRDSRVAYISSAPQGIERPYYHSTIEDFSHFDKDIKIDYFDLSEVFSDEALHRLLEYGTVYLSGGNTYTFLDDARKRNLYPILKKHLENGGLLIGASAGSIMMTPSISIASNADENVPGLSGFTGFGFVGFEFHPHYSHEDDDFLRGYMKDKNTITYLCKDGDGIFYSDGGIKLFGEVSEFI